MKTKSRTQPDSLWQALVRGASWPPIHDSAGRRALLETKRNIIRKLEERLGRQPLASP